MVKVPAARLLEREHELEALVGLRDAACSGAGQVVVVEGPPGIGKSALLAATRELADDRHMLPLVARGGELERDFAFGVVRQLLEPTIASLAPCDEAELFAGAAGLAAPLLRPGSSQLTGTSAGDVFPLLHGLYWLAAGLAASRPCLVAVDDAHWADAPSLRWLDYLARRLDGLAILIVLCARSTAPEAPVPLVEAIRAEPGVTVLRPAPLTESAAAAVLGDVFGRQPDAEFTRASHEASGGNPFLLTELARALAADGSVPDASTGAIVRHVRPEAIARGVLVRLGHLPEPAQALARALAVLDSDAELRHAAKLARRNETEAGNAVDRLVAAGFLQPGRPLRFTHPLIRSVIHGDLPASERAQAHRRAASVLAQDSRPAERVAAHLIVTAPSADRWVVEQLRAAPANSYSQGAPEVAGDYLRRALAEPPPRDQLGVTLLDLGRAESAAAHPDAADHLLDAFRLADDDAGRADAAEAATSVLLSAGRTGETLSLLETAAVGLAGSDPDRALEVESLLVAAGMLDPSAVTMAVNRMQRVGEGLQGNTRGERMMLCFLAYHRMWRSEDAVATADLARRALGGGRLIADRGVQPYQLFGPVMALICADELETAAEVLAGALADTRTRGSEITFSAVSCMRAALALRRGALDEVEAEACAALEITQRAGLLLGSAVNAALVISALIERGEFDGARDVLNSLGLAEAEISPAAPFNMLLSARGCLRVAEGRREEGMADLTECGRRNGTFGLLNPVFVPWRVDLALAKRSSGDLQTARVLADEEMRAARSWGTPGALGGAKRLLAVLSPDVKESVAGLRRAAALLQESPARLEHARALVDLGATLRRANARSEARPPLQAGLELAERCGASLLVERARTELLATGSRPRRRVVRGEDSLTASERRVAKLAAQGFSNPEIAQALFVSRKTVETHLGHVYEKLDIRSREGLSGVLVSRE